MIVIYIILGLILYGFIGGVTTFVGHILDCQGYADPKEHYDDDPKPEIFAYGIFWPLGIPIGLIAYLCGVLYRYLVKMFSRKKERCGCDE